MSLRSRVRTVFLLAVLELGSLCGVPMPPEKIRALMDSINRQKLAHTLPSEQNTGDDKDHTKDPWRMPHRQTTCHGRCCAGSITAAGTSHEV